MTRSKKSAQFLVGMRAGIPVVLGYIPVGIAYAVMARQAGFTALEACGMSLAVFAGAAQMMSVGMYAQGSGIIAIILTTFILNLRHIIMSTCVNSCMKSTKTGLRLIAAFGITDESFAIFTTHTDSKGSAAFFFGLITVTYASWNAGTLLGAIASDFLPPIVTGALGIALYAMFVGLLLPGVRGNSRLLLLVILTAGVNTVLSQFMSSSWAMIISTLACAAAGVFFVDTENDKEGRK